MDKRIYVGNLAWQTAWQDLKDHFKEHGFDPVRVDVLTTPNGRSRGCGIVSFNTSDEAQDAIAKMHDTQLHSRKIFVREDREQQIPTGREGAREGSPFGGGGGRGGCFGGGRGRGDRGGDRGDRGDRSFGGGRGSFGGGRGGGGRGGASRSPANGDARGRQLFVGNLAWSVTDDDLRHFFSEMGNVTRAEVQFNSSGRSRGNGIVVFSTPEEAQQAISSLHDLELQGRRVLVKLDEFA
jgi:RNA recognition motif-containing protein